MQQKTNYIKAHISVLINNFRVNSIVEYQLLFLKAATQFLM